MYKMKVRYIKKVSYMKNSKLFSFIGLTTKISLTTTLVGVATAAAVIGAKYLIKKAEEKDSPEEVKSDVHVNAPNGVGEEAKAELLSASMNDKASEERAKIDVDDLPSPRRQLN